MPANAIAIKLAKTAAVTGGAKAWELVIKGAANKQLRKAATKAGENAAVAAATGATTGGTNFFTQGRANRKNKRLAFDLARQIGASLSESTVIAGQRYFVVWRGDEPFEVFPPLPKNLGALAERPELQDFRGVRHSPTPKAKPKDAR